MTEKPERRKKLDEAMKALNKSNKDENLTYATNSDDKNTIAYGIPQLDDFVGGGHKEGTYTVIYGPEKVGKSTLVLQAIANAQKLGKICCYIDLEHTFEKKRATALGINLDELVLAEKCKDAEQALEIIRTLSKEKVVDVFVIDSVQAMSPKNEQENKGKIRKLEEKEIAELARTMSKFFKVVSPAVFNAKASVIMIGQVRIGGIGTFIARASMSGGEAIKHWASTRIFIRRGQGADAPVEKYKHYYTDPDGKERFKTMSRPLGFDSVLKLEKTRSSEGQREGSEIHLPFYYDTGFLPPVEKEVTVDDHLKEKSPEFQSKVKDIINNQKDLPEGISKLVDENFDELIEKPKKKRGRPKKEKKNDS